MGRGLLRIARQARQARHHRTSRESDVSEFSEFGGDEGDDEARDRKLRRQRRKRRRSKPEDGGPMSRFVGAYGVLAGLISLAVILVGGERLWVLFISWLRYP